MFNIKMFWRFKFLHIYIYALTGNVLEVGREYPKLKFAAGFLRLRRSNKISLGPRE